MQSKVPHIALALTLLVPHFGCGVAKRLSRSLGNEGEEAKSKRVTTGIVSSEMLGAKPYGFRVNWIDWDSFFRNTDLRIGDVIIGVDGVRYSLETRKNAASDAIGRYGESQRWKRESRKHGDSVKLTVWRRGKTLRIAGRLRAERFYKTRTGQRAMGKDGPPRMLRDQFEGAWSSWYERFQRSAIQVLDGGWRLQRFASRRRLRAWRAEKARVDYAVARYPSKFSDTLLDDWKRVDLSLQGPLRSVSKADLEYREIGKRRAEQFRMISRRAMDALLALHKSRTIPTFPTIDPLNDKIEVVAGKIVILPVLGSRNWISEAGHGFLVAGDTRRGFYFVDGESEGFSRVRLAEFRYRQLVTPKLRETYQIIGRIRPEPTMRIVSGRARTGLAIDVMGALVGKGMFVDLSKSSRGSEGTEFAGEATLKTPGTMSPASDADPRRIMETAIAALEFGNKAAWAALFAPWKITVLGQGRIKFVPRYWNRVPNSRWVDARRLILGDVYAVDVLNVSRPNTITTGTEFPGAPRIEEVDVEIGHYGKFAGEYRQFIDVRVNRVWKLQRLGDGPWKIVTRRAL